MRKQLTTRVARLEAQAGIGEPWPLLVIGRHDKSDDDVIGCGETWRPPVDRQPGESVSDLTERVRQVLKAHLLILHFRGEDELA